jgi:hypothetical protein
MRQMVDFGEPEGAAPTPEAFAKMSGSARSAAIAKSRKSPAWKGALEG